MKSLKIKYQNENIRKRINLYAQAVLPVIIMTIVSALLIFAGVFTYYRDKDKPGREVERYDTVPFDDLRTSYLIYSAELTEMPEKISSSYYAAVIDGHRLIISIDYEVYGIIKHSLEDYGSVTIRGKLEKLKTDEKLARKLIKEYFETYDYYSEDELESHGYCYLNCLDKTLQGEKETVRYKGPSFAFFVCGGIVLFFNIMLLCLSELPKLSRYRKPICGAVNYTEEDIDELANTESSVWLETLGIYLTPKIIVGTEIGIAAVEYGDIAKISIKSLKKGKDVWIYGVEVKNARHQLIITTRDGKNIVFSDFKPDFLSEDHNKLYLTCREHNPDVTVELNGKSPW